MAHPHRRKRWSLFPLSLEQALAAYPAAQRALGRLVPARWAVLTAKVDNLQVQVVPTRLGKEALAVPFRLLDALAGGQSPTVDQPMDVGVHGKGRHTEVLGQNDLCGLVPHSRQAFECGQIGRDLATVFGEQYLRERPDSLATCAGPVRKGE